MTTARIAAISCTHCPHTDMEAVEWALSHAEKFKPTHFVMLGDLLEANAASKHGDKDEASHSLDDEYHAAAELLCQIRKRVKGASLHWMHGNHDDNLRIADPNRIPGKLRDIVDWNRHPSLGPELKHWKQVPYEKSRRGVLVIGQVVLAHGFDCGESSDRTEGIQVNNMAGGDAWRLVVRGHTHQPRPVTRLSMGKIELPMWYSNVGHMGPDKPPYAKRKDTSRWGNGLLLATTTTKRWVSTREWDATIERRGGWW